ncbi:IS66 family insertion sequence element accessory protein TnpB [Rubellimicrobium aerolatum]|uniref:IS66 family insertion sequence element accessory protein TnpB n=1 Tax=Rubellimicrobium aerolatum TaxID=490979 RepID=A0ABW0S8J4_9RHOB|nr:IS66 family insertion sequence element accessory protein TnpB [Rubellimicrobium aerolatum]MBP1804187.1 transposase [Rubellimicrobium aerolatum]
MIAPHGQLRVCVAMRPIDLRKGMDGLALVVQELFELDPFSGAASVFRSKRGDRIKVLIWDRTGMVLVHKRLEGGKFVWLQVRDGVMRMSSAQISALFEGLDWRQVRPEAARRPQAAG